MQRDLVLRAGTGDHDAFASLAGAAYGRLHRTARLILRREDLASDAVQEALTSAWLHIRAVRDPERFDAWLNRLVVRACYQELRRSTRGRIEVHVETIDPPGVDDSTGSLADRDQLERGFHHLSAEHRAALVVHHYLGLSDAEAATVLEVPVGTYKSRLNRAHQALRAALDADARVAGLGQESIASSTSTPTVASASSATPTPTPIAVRDGEPWVAYSWPRVATDGRWAIYLMRPDGSDAHELAAGVPGEHRAPAWSGRQAAGIRRQGQRPPGGFDLDRQRRRFGSGLAVGRRRRVPGRAVLPGVVTGRDEARGRLLSGR